MFLKEQDELLRAKQLEENTKLQTFVNTLSVAKQDLAQKINQANQELYKMQDEFKHQKEEQRVKQENDHTAQKLEMKSKLYTDNVIKMMLIETHDSINHNLTVSKYNTVNIGQGDIQNNSAGAVLGQIMGTAKLISDEVKSK